MGQALRRVSGRVRPSAGTPSPAPVKRVPEPPPVTAAGPPQDRAGISDSEVASSSKDELHEHDTELDERDESYDKMLSQMVGRIKAKPGGRSEMGEASIVERYDRPLPKLRSSKGESPGGGNRPLPAGTLKMEQIHQIILLRQGKSDGQDSPMGIQEISERFRVDVNVVEKIVKSLSLPQEVSGNKRSEER